ncbi:MAG: deoxyinosine 3'endonuclease (endonuclease V) [Yoonia sp.]|jgi:hypothetical protein
MNMNSLINMGVRMLMNKGIKTGINVASRRGKSPQSMTPQERISAGKTRQTANRATRGMNMIRRFMR